MALMTSTFPQHYDLDLKGTSSEEFDDLRRNQINDGSSSAVEQHRLSPKENMSNNSREKVNLLEIIRQEYF